MRNTLTATAALAALALLLVPAKSRAQGPVNAEGYVLTQEGEPIPDVAVLLQYKGHIPQKYRTKTDKKGHYTHVNVYGGIYDITFTKEGMGEVTLQNYNIHDIQPPEKPPVFRLGPKKPAPAPDAAAAPAGPTPEQRAAAMVSELQAANDHLAAGRLDEALAGYEAIAAKVPEIAQVHHNMGLVLKRKGDLARAEAEFRKAAELKPDFAEPHGALSVILASAGKRDEAIVESEKAVELAPQSPQYLYNLAVLYKDTGKSQQAYDAFVKLEALDPQNVEIQFQAASALLGLGRMDEAIARLDKYVATAPADAPNVAAAKGILAAMAKKK